MKIHERVSLLLLGILFISSVFAARAQKPEWQQHVDWCIQNSDAGGSVDCPDKYTATYPECLVSGGRSCLMKKAIQSAKDGDYANAFRLAQICQCHNVNARDKIRDAGQKAVGDYLKTK
jgi:hypothetical protein